MPNADQRVGRGKIQRAIAGTDQFGRKLSKADRKKILHSGGEDITRGNTKAKKKGKKAKTKVKTYKPFLKTD